MAALAVLTSVGGALGAAPEPAIVAKSWELKIAYRDPQRIRLRLPGQAAERTFWYVIYTVTNDSGRDVDFYPTFDVVTDRLEVIKAGFGIHPEVNRTIRKRHARQFPFMVDHNAMFTRLLQGGDNARTSAVAFELNDPQADGFTVYVGGLSGEIARVSNSGFDPTLAEADENPRFFFLRKTLAIEYDLPGDERTHAEVNPVRVREKWVMR